MSESQPFGEIFRAMGTGYGRGQNDNRRAKYLAKHRAWCSDGVYCEERECEPGKAWRSTMEGEKWRAIDAVPEEQRTLQTGVRPETTTGQGKAEGRESVRVPAPGLSQANWPIQGTHTPAA